MDSVVSACYGSGTTVPTTDRTSCQAAVGKVAVCNPTGAKYHPHEAEACIAAWVTAYTDAAITAEELSDIDEACLKVFYNESGQGVECSADYDCNVGSGLRCVRKPGAAKGNCYEPNVVAGGDSCTAENATCVTGKFCSEDNGFVCVTKYDVGTDCSAKLLCKDYYVCSASTSKCESKLANDADCEYDAECEGGLCEMAADAAPTDKGSCSASISLNKYVSNCNKFK